MTLGYVWVGNPQQGEALVPAVRALGRPSAERVVPSTYVELQSRDDVVDGHARRRYAKGHYFRELTDEVIDTMVAVTDVGPFAPGVGLQAYGGAIADVPEDDTAFSHRDTAFELGASTGWTDPGEDEVRIETARSYAATLEPFASGVYVNVLGDEGAAGVRRAYSAEKLARLTAVKDTYDPQNVFHLNQNIAPSGASAHGRLSTTARNRLTSARTRAWLGSSRRSTPWASPGTIRTSSEPGMQGAQSPRIRTVEQPVVPAAECEQRSTPLPDAGAAVEVWGQRELAAERQHSGGPRPDPVRLGHREGAALRGAAEHDFPYPRSAQRGRREHWQLGAGLLPVEQRHAVRRPELLGVRQPLADVAVGLGSENDAARAGADEEEGDSVALTGGGPDEVAAGISGAVRALGEGKAVRVQLTG